MLDQQNVPAASAAATLTNPQRSTGEPPALRRQHVQQEATYGATAQKLHGLAPFVLGANTRILVATEAQAVKPNRLAKQVQSFLTFCRRRGCA